MPTHYRTDADTYPTDLFADRRRDVWVWSNHG